MRQKQAFTLIEIMVVVAIIAIIAVTLFLSMSRQRDKAEDARVKAYLNRLKIAFEDYYNDYNCYPPTTWFDGPEDCNSTNLSPYLTNIQCAKKTGLPYIYETDVTGCKWFKLYATLETADSDPEAIAQRSAIGSPLGNYGISSSNTTISVFYSPTSTPSPLPSASLSPSPSPSPSPGILYYCQRLSNCSLIPPGLSCSPSYSDPNCGDSQLCATTISTCN